MEEKKKGKIIIPPKTPLNNENKDAKIIINPILRHSEQNNIDKKDRVKDKKEALIKLSSLLEESLNNELLSNEFSESLNNYKKMGIIEDVEVNNLIKRTIFHYLNKLNSHLNINNNINNYEDYINNILNKFKINPYFKDGNIIIFENKNNIIREILEAFNDIKLFYNTLPSLLKLEYAQDIESTANILYKLYKFKVHQLSKINNKTNDNKKINEIIGNTDSSFDIEELRLKFKENIKFGNLFEFLRKLEFSENNFENAIKSAVLLFLYKELNEGSPQLVEHINLILNNNILDKGIILKLMNKTRLNKWLKAVLSNDSFLFYNAYVLDDDTFLNRENLNNINDKKLIENNLKNLKVLIFFIFKYTDWVRNNENSIKELNDLIKQASVEKLKDGNILSFTFLTFLRHTFKLEETNNNYLDDFDKNKIEELIEKELSKDKNYLKLYKIIDLFSIFDIEFIKKVLYKNDKINNIIENISNDIYNIKYTFSTIYLLIIIYNTPEILNNNILLKESLENVIKKIDTDKLNDVYKKYNNIIKKNGFDILMTDFINILKDMNIDREIIGISGENDDE
ncbi:MAG: hypothetical protein ACP5T6_02705 [Candidatus Micrarchaeia archaeon]